MFLMPTPYPIPRTTPSPCVVLLTPPGSSRTSMAAPTGSVRRQRHRGQLRQHLRERSRRIDDLAVGKARALTDRVPDPKLHRVEPERRRDRIHLRLVGETGLDRAEPPHRPARRVVGVDTPDIDGDVGHDVGPDAQRRRVRDHGTGRSGVRASVEDHLGPDVDELAVPVGAVLVAQDRRVPVDMADERLVAAIRHLHRTPGGESQHAGVDVHRQVFPAAERATDTGDRHPHLAFRQGQTGCDLGAVDVQPLGGDLQVDAAVGSRHREPRLRAEERLVLHADLVRVDHHDFGAGLVRVADAYRLVAYDVSPVMQLWSGGIEGCSPGVGQRLQHLVVDSDQAQRSASYLRMVGRDECDRLTLVADDVDREDRAVLTFLAGVLLTGHVRMGEHRVDTGQRLRGGGVDASDPRVRVRTAQGRAPEHALTDEIGGVREVPAYLRLGVRAARTGADTGTGQRLRDPARAGQESSRRRLLDRELTVSGNLSGNWVIGCCSRSATGGSPHERHGRGHRRRR